MNHRTRLLVAAAGTVWLFVLVQLGALALAAPFSEAGFQAIDDPTDPRYSVVYVGAILVATALMLAAFRWNLTGLIRGVIVLVSAVLAWYVFVVLLPPVFTVAGLAGLPILCAATVGIALLVHPEWYVIDAAGVIMGAGAAGLFGISFGLLPALVLLVVLAVYDAISVYGTEHMLSLAEGVMDIKIPVIFVVPLTLSYSFLSDHDDGGKTPDDAASGADDLGADSDATVETSDGSIADEDDRRDALYIGLGDAVIPTVLVVSAAVFAPAPSIDVAGLALNIPAVTALVGTLLGLVVLLRMVLEGRAHAGLPLLNGGAIGGYLVGAVWSGIPLLEALGLAGLL